MTKLPPHLEDQVFIKQLMDVEDISLEDDPLIVEYTMEKFDYINSIRVATKNDDVSEEEVENVSHQCEQGETGTDHRAELSVSDHRFHSG